MDAAENPSEKTDDAVLKAEQLTHGKSSTVVDWRVLEAEEDSCSICLETFTDEDPSTVTSCSHNFHLQCIMEWAQRSTECPNCWQTLSLNDPDSQELLSACFEERNLRLQEMSPPTFDDFEFRRRILLANRDEADLERRILQHLAAAAAGLSIHSDNRRDSHSNSSNIVNNSTDNNSRERLGTRQISLPIESSSTNQSPQRAGSNPSSNNNPASSYWGFFTGENTSSPSPPSSSPPSSSPPSRSTSSGNPNEREVGGFGDLFKSRTWSSYRESFHRSTRSMREKFKARNSSAVADLSARAREMGAGVVRAFESMTMPSDTPRDNQSSSSTSTPISPSPSSPLTTLSAPPSLPSSSASLSPTTIDSPSSVTDSSPQPFHPSILSTRSPSPLSHESSTKAVHGIAEDTPSKP